jgi:RNA polymerase sigma-70 factor (ECF subfamily)
MASEAAAEAGVAMDERGTTVGLAEAYERHAETVRRTAYSVVRDSALAEDVTQDVFLALWVRPDRYDPDRGTFERLLRVMARSRALDAARRTSASQRAHDRLKGQVEAERPATEDPADAAVAAGDGRALRAAVMRLPRAQRETISLAYWGDLTSEEVAARQRVPTATAKSRIRIGLTKLRRDYVA